jgi:2-methylcitrate dehydratase
VYTSEDGYDKSGKDPQKWTPETSETADHSLPYIVAKAMFDGDIGAHSYELEAIRDPALRAFMQKIKVIPDSELTAIYPKYYATRIVAVLQDGRELSQRVDDIPGFATRPMTRVDYENKFKKYANLSMEPEQMARVFVIVWSLDQQASMTSLLEALILEGKT